MGISEELKTYTEVGGGNTEVHRGFSTLNSVDLCDFSVNLCVTFLYSFFTILLFQEFRNFGF